jgi:hypothetical protein
MLVDRTYADKFPLVHCAMRVMNCVRHKGYFLSVIQHWLERAEEMSQWSSQSAL